MKENEIESITVRKLTEERDIKIKAKVFADCSGDGTIAYLADAEYMFGREGKEVFGENGAREKSDAGTMGNTIMFKAIDVGKKTEFKKPFWAYDYNGSKLVGKVKFIEINSGYWWIEVGGKEFDTLHDAEKTREECLKIIYGVWGYIKNGLNDERANNLVLDWIGTVPAKREGRRFIDDYVLTENDVINHVIFQDAVGYGGWHIDDHPLERFKFFAEIEKYDDKDETLWHNGIYTIPYRSLYSKNIKNLFLGGRLISVSHRALASTRVMATCAVLGQAVGTAASLAVKKSVDPRQVNVSELQKILLKDDCYLPQITIDTGDIAKLAKVSCSSFIAGHACENVINGQRRPIAEEDNSWAAKNDGKQWINLLISPIKVKEIRIVFDSDLNAEITQTLSDWIKERQPVGLPKTLIKSYAVKFYKGERLVKTIDVQDNFMRMNVLPVNVICDKIEIGNFDTYGDPIVKIYEIELY